MGKKRNGKGKGKRKGKSGSGCTYLLRGWRWFSPAHGKLERVRKKGSRFV